MEKTVMSIRQQKPCEVCEQWFNPYSSTDRYCSGECRRTRDNLRKRDRAEYMREYRRRKQAC